VRELAIFAAAVALISWALVRDGKTTASRTQDRSNNTSEEIDKNFERRQDSRVIDDTNYDQKRSNNDIYAFESKNFRNPKNMNGRSWMNV
jgi:hypothetical protein